MASWLAKFWRIEVVRVVEQALRSAPHTRRSGAQKQPLAVETIRVKAIADDRLPSRHVVTRLRLSYLAEVNVGLRMSDLIG